MTEPEQCQTMREVRESIDALDAQIVALLSRRFRFIDAASRIKLKRNQIRDEERKAVVLEQARRHALEAGAPAEQIVDVYDRLVEHSIAYELQKFDRRR